MDDRWIRCADGFRCGDIAVFPFFFGAWEVWQMRNGEWTEVKDLKPFPDIETAKAAALTRGEQKC